MNVAIIAEKYLATGYRLAGVHSIPVRDVNEALEKFKRSILDMRFEIILVQEEFAERIKEEAKLIESTGKLPIISIIPGFKGPTKGRAMKLYDLVSQAVGTRLKMEG